jgi:hypothetical protein
MARKQRPSKLDPYIDKVGVLPDREVAELADVTAENVRAFRKRRGIPASWRGEGKASGKSAAPKKSRKESAGRRKSRLDPYMDKVGVLPDREVAELAGVTAENVRALRKRRGIPANWRGEGQAKAPRKRTEILEPAAPPTKVKERRSKLSPHRELIGILPDSRIASMADTAAQNVRAYRLRHAIPARWRGEGEPLPNEEAILALYTDGKPAPAPEKPRVSEPASAPGKPRVSEPAPAPEAIPTPECREGYAITVQGPEGEISYVVVANDIAEAAEKAVEGVRRRGIEGRLLSVRFLARALGA